MALTPRLLHLGTIAAASRPTDQVTLQPSLFPKMHATDAALRPSLFPRIHATDVGQEPDDIPPVGDSWRDADWSFTTRRAPAASAEMAACIAGEARSLVYPAIHTKLRPHVLEPLHADSFMVLSTTWTVSWHRDWPATLAHIMTNETVAAAVESGDPVSWVVTDFPGLQARAPPAWRHCFCDETQNTSSCWSGVPTSLRQPSTRRAVCSPTPSLTVSWRGCLTQITAAEAERGAAYPLVLRMRPDLYFTRPFTPGWRPPPALEPAHPAISGRRGHQPSAPGGGAFAAFVSDFAALMTRDVASISLKQQPAAGVHETCWMPSPHREYCNACIVNASGLGRALRVWLPDAVLIRQCTNETAHSDGPTAELYPYCAGEADEVNPVIRDEDLQRLRAIWAKGNMTEDLSRPQG